MSMDYYASYADVVELSAIKSIVPTEYNNLFTLLEKLDVPFNTVAEAIDYGDNPDDLAEAEWKSIEDLLLVLVGAFEKATNIKLEVEYHRAKGRGCDVDGGFFSAYNIEILNPVISTKHHKLITSSSYVTYG